MKIRINNSLIIDTKQDLQQIAEKIRDRTLDLGDDNFINWVNVWCVEVLK